MDIYLVQHGEAKLETEDPLRPLTDKGKNDVSTIAAEVAKKGVRVSQIFHSSKLRAKQTAEIFAPYLSVARVEEIKGIMPLDDPEEAKRLIEDANENLMIVGHLPHLSKLASLLIIGNPDKEIIKFRMAGVIGLTRTDMNWAITCFFIPYV